MDISVYNQAQDGYIQFKDDQDMFQGRVASIPSLHGEDIVIRLFDQSKKIRSIKDLSINDTRSTHIKSILEKKQGVFLVTGPTGSGKTSTLYSCIQELKHQKNINIISLEDPIETQISGIRQCPVDQNHLTFEKGLKAALRQDPDVIVIGEIRDAQTAKVVFEAAYTGHLILSSLHTGNVKSTLSRLSQFGIDSFLINQSLLGILSQQLIPQSCPDCQEFNGTQLINRGCDSCLRQGAQGRILCSELLVNLDSNQSDIFHHSTRLDNASFFSFASDIDEKEAQKKINTLVARSIKTSMGLDASI